MVVAGGAIKNGVGVAPLRKVNQEYALFDPLVYRTSSPAVPVASPVTREASLDLVLVAVEK